MTPAVLDVLEFFGNLTIGLCRFMTKTAGLMGGLVKTHTRTALKWFKSKRSARKKNLSQLAEAVSDIPIKKLIVADIPVKKLIGQEKAKLKLNLLFEGFKHPDTCQSFILLVGAMGIGKSEFARQSSKKLPNRRSFIEINCQTIKNIEVFYNKLYEPYIKNREVIVFFDETHALSPDLSTLFCSFFNNDSQHIRTIQGGDGKDYEFNFMKQTFLFATTEEDKLFRPLSDRFEQVHFAEYSLLELAKIIKSECKAICFQGDTHLALAKRCENPRQAVRLARNIKNYLRKSDENVFTKDHVDSFCADYEIYPLGLRLSELKYLEMLNGRPATLVEMSAKTRRSRSALQYGIEEILHKNDLIKIDRKREITEKGKQYIRENLVPTR